MSKQTARQLKTIITAAHDTSRVAGLTHNYYKYPARLSPTFVKAVIETFTSPGDWILDPFVGGGTTLVEARALGRSGVGVDNNELAVFVSRVKTTILPQRELNRAQKIVRDLTQKSKLTSQYKRPISWIENGYLKHLSSKSVWRIRKQIEIYIGQLSRIRNPHLQSFMRCALLYTAQWALDNRKVTPSVVEFRKRFESNVLAMIDGMYELNLSEKESVEKYRVKNPKTHIIHSLAEDIPNHYTITEFPSPKLVLTSPPYPGVHVLYHRWQIHGRKETPVPFWIANCLDGHGEANYTFGWRKEPGLNNYFRMLEASFNSIKSILDKNTIIVQVVAFSKPSWQLPRYLNVMEKVGLTENDIPIKYQTREGRIWREIPNRKWYATQRRGLLSGRELILIHRVN
jgi:hypothetical protein